MKQTTFSSRLAYYRKRAGFKQEELAVQLNVTPQAVSKWENGSFPDGTLLPKISQILGVSLDILFGLKDVEPEPDYLQEYMKKLSKLEESERTEQAVELFYRFLCAYDRNIQPHQVRFPENPPRVIYAHLRADSALGLMRLNPDMQFFTFVKIPEKGVGSYAKISERMLDLFRLLSDENALKLITFAESLPRDYILTMESFSRHLQIPEKEIRRIVTDCIHLGIIWELKADFGGTIHNTYGYVHSVPLTTILVLSEALINFIANCEPDIDIWKKGAFRPDSDKDKNK
ncbi:MAG: helix-turn-helix transcriptional regulator [Oscillospiraceae bacterium]|nr:helix-turn-helix transcriptional regulator [Oscillospiraceae bacterium]